MLPVQELKAYKRVELAKSKKVQLGIHVPNEAFLYYDKKMSYGMHQGDYTVQIGTSCKDICKTFAVKVRGGKII